MRRLDGPQSVLRKCRTALIDLKSILSGDNPPLAETNKAVLRIIQLADDLARIYGFDPRLITEFKSIPTQIDSPDSVILDSTIEAAAERKFSEAALSSTATSDTLRKLWPHAVALLKMASRLCQVLHMTRLLAKPTIAFPVKVMSVPPKTPGAKRSAEDQALSPPLKTRSSAEGHPFQPASHMEGIGNKDLHHVRSTIEMSRPLVSPEQITAITSLKSDENPGSPDASSVVHTHQAVERFCEHVPQGERSSRPEDVRLISEVKTSRLNPQYDMDGMRQALQVVWSNFVARALGSPDGDATVLTLTLSERAFRGVPPTPAMTRHLLEVARVSMAGSDMAAIGAGDYYEDCHARPAEQMARIDIPSAYSKYLEDAPECLDKLMLQNVIDHSKLDRYMSDLMGQVPPKFTGVAPDFSGVIPAVEIFNESGKPIYIQAASILRNRKRTKCFDLIKGLENFPEDLRSAIDSGVNVLVFNPAGAGKTLLLERIIPAIGAVVARFNASNQSGVIGSPYEAQGINKLRRSQSWDGLVDLVQHYTPNPVGLLLDECTFLTPRQLSMVGIFDQIILVGDPCQVGVPRSAEYIYDFMSRINAFIKEDGVVYRVSNPALFGLLNYVGYGGRFTAAKKNYALTSSTIQLVSCNQHRLSKAVSVLLMCLSHSLEKRRIIFASQDLAIINLVNSLIEREVNFRHQCEGTITWSLLSNLQGKECDVLIFDPSEVDTFVIEPFAAARYLTMLLGRATSTICALLPARPVATSPQDLAPFSLMFLGCCQYEPPSSSG